MTGKTVIITGATKGLGRELARAFVAAGHNVLGLYASDDEAAEKLRQELVPLGPPAVLIKHDVSIESADLWMRPEVAAARDLVLINNAWASFEPQPFHLLEWQHFESGFGIGFKGSWLASRAVVRPMVRCGRGTIVNILTNAVTGKPPKGFAAYAAAKHALRGLTLSLATEYFAKGIRVLSVSPGFMDTPLTAKWDPRLRQAMLSAGDVSTPELVARVVVRLVESDETVGNGEDYGA